MCRIVTIVALFFAALSIPALGDDKGPGIRPPTPGEKIRSVSMKGELKAFWNVTGGGDKDYNREQRIALGFELVDLCNTYSDYSGKPRTDIRPVRDNPWSKPDAFETIIKRNTSKLSGKGSILVHDIEFDFEDKAEQSAGQCRSPCRIRCDQGSGVSREILSGMGDLVFPALQVGEGSRSRPAGRPVRRATLSAGLPRNRGKRCQTDRRPTPAMPRCGSTSILRRFLRSQRVSVL